MAVLAPSRPRAQGAMRRPQRTRVQLRTITRPCTFCTMTGTAAACSHLVKAYPAHQFAEHSNNAVLRTLGVDPAVFELVDLAFYPGGGPSLESQCRPRRAADNDPGGRGFDGIARGLPWRQAPFGRSLGWWWAAIAGACADLAGLDDGRKLTLASKVFRLGIESGEKAHLKDAAEQMLAACESNGLLDDAGEAYCVSVIRRGLRKGWIDAAAKEAAGVPTRLHDRERADLSGEVG